MNEQGENILVIGHPEETARYISKIADDSELLPIHHTVSEIGIRMYINEAKENGKTVLLEDIVEFRRAVLGILVEEMKKGDCRYIAYCGVCPCDGNRFSDGRCRCSRRQIQNYYANLEGLGLDEVFKIVKLSKPDIEYN